MAVIPEQGHQGLRITAHLRGSVVIDQPYGLDLAGLVAGRVRRERSESAQSMDDDPQDLELPLSRCEPDDVDLWHWAASCAVPITDGQIDPRTYYREVDLAWAHRAAERPMPYLHPTSQSYRDVMIPAPALECTALWWAAWGDRERLEQLLEPIAFIGRRRMVGEGAVLRWTVDVVEDPSAGWSHIDGSTIVRPCPEQCAKELGVDYRVGYYALRPPSWNPARMMALAMTPEAWDLDLWG